MLTLVLLVLPLGLESFAVAAALGVARVPPRDRLRVSLILSGFEAGAPIVGLAAGVALGRAISSAADYVAAAVLLALGAHMIVGEEADEDERIERLARVRGWAAVLLALSVSVDEVAIGFPLGLLDVPIVPVLIAIALQAFICSRSSSSASGRGDRVPRPALIRPRQASTREGQYA